MKKLLNTLYITSENSYLALDGENMVILEDEKVKGRVPLHNGKIAKIAERRQEQAAVTAWWGTLYPKFCFSQFPEENKGQKDDIKISFWLAQALDW